MCEAPVETQDDMCDMAMPIHKSNINTYMLSLELLLLSGHRRQCIGFFLDANYDAVIESLGCRR